MVIIYSLLPYCNCSDGFMDCVAVCSTCLYHKANWFVLPSTGW